ncbi:hypothetical protein KSD_41770 [Ktedonobacter sp. SOSP1-85]|nr:hypothetical protein KSD_41770 [Ktedonobacter sp. SOSP1-85]
MITPLPGEILWDADWISILDDAAGVEEEARYVAFRGLDQAQVAGDLVHFGSSIRLEKVLTPEVLLVHEMNGAPLPREHGFPLRILVPDYVGARSVKWLQDITLQSQPSTNYFQARDYKTFPPTVAAETVDWEQGKTLEEIALNAVICTPKSGETLQAGSVLVQGYALAGEEAPVERVELSIDREATWIPATIREKTDRWIWCFWEARLSLPSGKYQLLVRA